MNLDRISTLLASGLKPSQVATVVGVSPARISQLLADESFKLILDSKLAEVQKADVEEAAISAKYNAAEHLLVNQVMELAPMAELRDVVGALRIVAERQEKMKARTTVQAPVLAQQLTVVSVNLPSHALKTPEVTINGSGEIVAIGDRHLAPMSSEAVVNMFKKKEGGYHEPSPSNPSPKESSAEAVSTSEIGFLEYARS